MNTLIVGSSGKIGKYFVKKNLKILFIHIVHKNLKMELSLICLKTIYIQLLKDIILQN